MERDNQSTETETVPLADLAAEAANEGSPAQSVPETIPPPARVGHKDVPELNKPEKQRRKGDQ